MRLFALAAATSILFAVLPAPASADPPKKPVDMGLIGEFAAALGAGIPREVLLGPPDKLAEFIDANKAGVLKDVFPRDGFRPAVAALRQFLEEQGEPPPPRRSPNGTAQTPGGASTSREQFNREALRFAPKDPVLRIELGNAAYTRKDYRTSLRDFEQAIRLDPTNADALLGYGHSANELGDYQLASMAAKQLLSREPTNRDALGLYHTVKDRAPAVTLQSSIFQGGPASAGAEIPAGTDAGPAPGFASAVGGAYVPPRQTPEQVAAAARAQAAAAGPGAAARSASFTKDAESRLRLGDYPTAHQLASQAIAFNASNVQALNYRAIASGQMRRYSDAVTDASAALALAPGNAAVLQTRAWAFNNQGNYQAALQDAEMNLSLNPANPMAFKAFEYKAHALAGLKDRAGALEALRRSAALDPRAQNLLERALQLPEDQDMTLLFDNEAMGKAAAPPPARTGKRFARLALLSAMGGLLIALAILHVVSASWREKVNLTIRRVLAPSDAAGSDAPAAVQSATPLPSPGAAFWLQYELIKEIGLGGMGIVYEAQDRSLERRVAVKKMRDEIRIDPHERRRFVNEAKLVAQLRHPNIVDIYAIVEEGQEVYLVFEFVSGRTLGDQLKSSGPMGLDEARQVLYGVSEAVEHAHAAQIVHRDLKPSNIMITDDGRVKVMDFGVARQAKDAITKMSMTNTVVGTLPYMAPEQEQGTVRRESDVFALGVCLYEMLTGHLPFTGGGAAMLLNKLNGKHIPPSQRNPELPAGLDEVLAKALVPDPDKRYHTPSEFVAALDAVIARSA